MIRRIVAKLVSGAQRLRRNKAAPGDTTSLGQRREVQARSHKLKPDGIATTARQVIHTLRAAGFDAYIVGGAVRDLLLGHRPKDFDIATNARPEQVKRLFRRAFIIGRRFRIVHVLFGEEVVEVTTFRALRDAEEALHVTGNEKVSRTRLAGRAHVVDHHGRLLRDNVWGAQEEDAARRDFTVNALYYCPERECLVDYHGGLEDLQRKSLRMIGEPAARYREDPVRLIRAARLAAKLSFTLEPHTSAAVAPSLQLLAHVPPSRLFDEMIKLLLTGHAERSATQLLLMRMEAVFPLLAATLFAPHLSPRDAAFIRAVLQFCDTQAHIGAAPEPALLIAALLWREVCAQCRTRITQGERPTPALQAAIGEVFDARIGDISGRGKLGAQMREIWLLQPRFEQRAGQAPWRLVQQSGFEAALAFLRLRAHCADAAPELSVWWQDFAAGDEKQQQELCEQIRAAQSAAPATEEASTSAKRPRRRRRKRNGERSTATTTSA